MASREQRLPLYVLRPDRTAAAVSRLSRADRCVDWMRTRVATLRELDFRLDFRIEAIELRLRALIVRSLDGDRTLLPSM